MLPGRITTLPNRKVVAIRRAPADKAIHRAGGLDGDTAQSPRVQALSALEAGRCANRVTDMIKDEVKRLEKEMI